MPENKDKKFYMSLTEHDVVMLYSIMREFPQFSKRESDAKFCKKFADKIMKIYVSGV